MIAFAVVGVVGLVLLVGALLFGDVLDGLLPDVSFDGGALFSTEVLGAFLAAFGVGGWVGTAQSGSPALGLAAALGAGVVVGGTTAAFLRAVLRMHTDPTPRTADLVGAIGTVVTAIPPGGYGEVSIPSGGQRLKLNARADGALPAGASVVVVDVPSSTSVVVTETGF